MIPTSLHDNPVRYRHGSFSSFSWAPYQPVGFWLGRCNDGGDSQETSPPSRPPPQETGLLSGFPVECSFFGFRMFAELEQDYSQSALTESSLVVPPHALIGLIWAPSSRPPWRNTCFLAFDFTELRVAGLANYLQYWAEDMFKDQCSKQPLPWSLKKKEQSAVKKPKKKDNSKLIGYSRCQRLASSIAAAWNRTVISHTG